MTKDQPPNGLRYLLVGGTRQRHFDGTDLKPCKVPENAQTPTSRVHAVLGGVIFQVATSWLHYCLETFYVYTRD